MKPILVITGPTASGKSGLAVELALRFNGEVISADSRQIYKGLDIGTGKITKDEMRGVTHHLLDIADPKDRYTVTAFRKAAEIAIENIQSQGKLPIICGGTGFYIEAVVKGITYPATPRDADFEERHQQFSTTSLVEQLAQIDPTRAATIDHENRRRVLRALEIATTLGSVPKAKAEPRPDWKFLQIGITTPDEILKEKIRTRVVSRIKDGMIEEVAKLQEEGLSKERCLALGLEYRYISEYLEAKSKNQLISEEKFITNLSTKIWQYARRQKAWFKRDKNIEWFEIGQKETIVKRVEEFLK